MELTVMQAVQGVLGGGDIRARRRIDFANFVKASKAIPLCVLVMNVARR